MVDIGISQGINGISKIFRALLAGESHLNTWGPRIGNFFGLTGKTAEGGKKKNQDEIHYIRMLAATFENEDEGLSDEERKKLACFIHWNYNIRKDRTLPVRLIFFWLSTHRKNDWRDILSYASTPSKDGTDVKVTGKEDSTRTVTQTIPGEGGSEAQKILKEGIAFIGDLDKNDFVYDIVGFEKARKYWEAVGLPLMPNKEYLDSIEKSLTYLPRYLMASAKWKTRQIERSLRNYNNQVRAQRDLATQPQTHPTLRERWRASR